MLLNLTRPARVIHRSLSKKLPLCLPVCIGRSSENCSLVALGPRAISQAASVWQVPLSSTNGGSGAWTGYLLGTVGTYRGATWYLILGIPIPSLRYPHDLACTWHQRYLLILRTICDGTDLQVEYLVASYKLNNLCENCPLTFCWLFGVDEFYHR